jgi:hypothetical protein
MDDSTDARLLNVRIAGFDTAHEAELARAYLVGLGIPCRVEGDMIPREFIPPSCKWASQGPSSR